MNKTMMQFFEWYYEADGSLWKVLKSEAEGLSHKGINMLWLPPAYKGGAGAADTGYDPYDLYDLGEFDQKGSIRTKYGAKDEYLDAIEEAHKNGIEIIADIVLDHKGGADDTEWVKVVKVDPNNRNNKISAEYDIRAWTKFTFDSRHDKYSEFKWNWENFDGVDWDDNKKEKAIFEFTGEGKSWDPKVDNENGNYDYLMCADIDVSSPVVYEELLKWGIWYTLKSSLDGFRLDAVKHIQSDFYYKWLKDVRNVTEKNLFAVGEYWSGDVIKLNKYLENTCFSMCLFDVPLHNNFYNVCRNKESFDLRSLIKNTLIASNPNNAVTFVDNHDTERGQSLESFVDESFKLQAYTFILTREEGIPCIFYGDYYGIKFQQIIPLREKIDKLLFARNNFAYGHQEDFFVSSDIIGWTREGGLTALISIRKGGTVQMHIGKEFAGKIFKDITDNVAGEVSIDNEGMGYFTVNDSSYSVWCYIH